MQRARRHALATTAMFAGSALVFGFIVLMNEYSTPPPKAEQEATTQFEVEKKKRKKPVRKQEPKPKRVQRTTPQHAPTPDLSSQISDVALELPGFDGSDLGRLSDEVLGTTSKQMVMDENSVDDPPKPVSRVAPGYPESARRRGITGFVKMKILINESGDVEKVKVVDASPQGVFEDAALATIRQWRFSPAAYQGQPVRSWANQTMRFTLN